MKRNALKDESITKFILFWMGLIAVFAFVSQRLNLVEDVYQITITTWTISVMPIIIGIVLDRSSQANTKSLLQLGFVFLSLFVVDFLIQWGVHTFQLFDTNHDRSTLALFIMSIMRAVFGTLMFKVSIDRGYK
ncbi:MAG: hypothetical protein AAFP97_04085 [Pseudomonadota bacterium]